MKTAIALLGLMTLTIAPPAMAQELYKLLPPVEDYGGFDFGYSVAIEGDIALIGTGEVIHPYHLKTKTFLDPFSGEIEGQESSPLFMPPGDLVYDAIAVNGTQALVGSPVSNSAYLFDVLTGELLEQFSHGSEDNTFISTQFGQSVALGDDGTVLIGAPGHQEDGEMVGAVYIRAGAAQARQSTDVPEPGMVLGVFAAGVMGYLKRRKKP